MSLRNPLRNASRSRARALAAALSLCLSACIIGGTGTDTEKGVGPDSQNTNTDPNALTGISARVTDSAGRPLSGVTLGLFDPAYRPDLGPFPEAVVANKPESLVSDTGGYVRLSLKAAGKFVVEGVSQGKTLFFDTLAVADLQRSAIFTFRARAPRAFRGKVKLASGLRIDSGRVFIRGTGRMAKVDSAGGYDLGVLPADAERMALGVRFVSSPMTVLRVALGSLPVSDTSVRPAYSCKTLSGDSATKAMTPSVLGTQAGPQAKLDTGVVNSALKSCGTLQEGSVINVMDGKSAAGPATMSKETSLLVLKGTDSTNYTSPKVLGPVVAPLAQCVPDLGKESTAYDVVVQTGVASGDLLVEDLSPTCRAP
jgi:hypothetical protein